MLTLVLLGGNSIHNKAWIQEVNNEMLPFYDNTHIHHYRHWNEEAGNMDLEHECEQLHTYLKMISGDIVLFCKSLGCILGLKTIVEHDIFIKEAVFVGFPLGWTQYHAFPIEDYLKKLKYPVLRIQKTDDPAGGYAAIVERLGKISAKFTFKEIPGDNHNYLEVKELKEIILDANGR